MKKKYYIRGIGIGVAVTVVVMHYALANQKQPMTDAEIMERARALGMIESTVLSEYGNSVSDDDANHVTSGNEAASDNQTASDNQAASDNQVAASATTGATTLNTAEPGTTAPSTTEPTATVPGTIAPTTTSPTATGTTAAIIMITVEGGDSSYSVAKKLYEAGLVDSAAEYDEFLCANGFDKTISVGTHPIPENASDWEIADLITSVQ